MTQRFKIRKNGNINGMCPGGKKHYTECIHCENLLSINKPLGIPVLIICKAGGIEGYTMGKEREGNGQEVTHVTKDSQSIGTINTLLIKDID